MQNRDVLFPKVPERPKVKPKAAQVAAWNSFKTKHADWRIRWARSQTPASLMGPPVRLGSGSPEQIARTFLRTHIELLAMRSSLEDLQVYLVEQRLRANHVTFQQMYAGVPVEGGVYAVNMTKDGRIYYVSGNYFTNISGVSTSASLSAFAAITQAKQDLGTGLKMDGKPKGKLVILPYSDGFRLAWKVLIPASKPHGRWVYYISAQDGSVLGGYNDMDDATASGDVFDHHPDAGPVVTRSLTHLNGAGRELDGSFIRVINDDDPEAYETDGIFSYSAGSTHFDEVMVYYHATEFQKYIGGQVGYLFLNYPNSKVQVQATVHYGIGAGASSPNILEFSDGDGLTYNDFAKEDNVIAHEYMHLITEDIAYNGLDATFAHNYNQTDAMDEGFSDYFGGSYAGSPDIGVYVVIGPGQLRDMENNYTISDWDDPNDPLPASNYHQGSLIFTGVLWDLRQQLGINNANVLIFEGLQNINQSDPDFVDGRDAILAADFAVNGGANSEFIQNTFADRGIGTPAPSLDVSVTGNTHVEVGQTGYYSSNVTHADGSVSYQWYFRPKPNYFWQPDGTSPNYQHTFTHPVSGGSNQAAVKVVVTSAGETATDIQQVTVYP